MSLHLISEYLCQDCPLTLCHCVARWVQSLKRSTCSSPLTTTRMTFLVRFPEQSPVCVRGTGGAVVQPGTEPRVVTREMIAWGQKSRRTGARWTIHRVRCQKYPGTGLMPESKSSLSSNTVANNKEIPEDLFKQPNRVCARRRYQFPHEPDIGGQEEEENIGQESQSSGRQQRQRWSRKRWFRLQWNWGKDLHFALWFM